MAADVQNMAERISLCCIANYVVHLAATIAFKSPCFYLFISPPVCILFHDSLCLCPSLLVHVGIIICLNWATRTVPATTTRWQEAPVRGQLRAVRGAEKYVALSTTCCLPLPI